LKINGHDPQVVRDRVSFEHLTPVFPSEICLLARQSTISTQLICFSIGKGQRGMVVLSQTGKTMLLKRNTMQLLLIILKFILLFY
jgi:transcription termination factor Rho